MNKNNFLETLEELEITNQEKDLLKKAYFFAKEAHKDQKRKTGDPYFIHPLEVSINLWKKYNDIELTCAGFLHDIIEDCPQITREDIYESFGLKVGFLVDAVTKTKFDFLKETIKFQDKLERFLWAGMRDIRVFLLKLADRDDNLKTLSALKDQKQIRMTFETRAIYEPLRNILSFYDEELSIKQVEKKFWRNISKKFINEPNLLKKHLIDQSFEHFDDKLFDMIYLDSSSPLWSLNDYETYAKITTNNELSKNIKFISIKGNKDNFEAQFKFTGGTLIKGAKLNISGYN